MKIALSFTATEDQRAEALMRVILRELGGRAIVKQTPERDGYLHSYISTPQPPKP